MSKKTEYEKEKEMALGKERNGIFSWLDDPDKAPVLFFASQFFHHGPGNGLGNGF